MKKGEEKVKIVFTRICGLPSLDFIHNKLENIQIHSFRTWCSCLFEFVSTLAELLIIDLCTLFSMILDIINLKIHDKILCTVKQE